MSSNDELIKALNEAHNAIERAINTLRNQAAQHGLTAEQIAMVTADEIDKRHTAREEERMKVRYDNITNLVHMAWGPRK